MARPKYEVLSRDLARVLQGQDAERATKRLAVNGGQTLLKAIGLPSPFVDAAAGVVKQVLGKQLYSNGLVEPDQFYSPEGERAFFEWALGLDYGLIAIVGAGGTGKTSLAAQFAYNWMPWRWTPEEQQAFNRELVLPGPDTVTPTAYIVNYPSRVLHGTPLKRMRWHISSLMETEDNEHWGESKLHPGDILLMPDAYTYINSQSFGVDEMQNVAEQLPALVRHLKARAVADFHDTSQTGKGILQARATIYKPLFGNYAALERDTMLRRAHTAMDAFTQCGNCGHGVRLHDGMKRCRGFCHCAGYSPVIPADQRNSWAFVYCEEIDYQGLIKTTKRPPWYSMALSEAHAEQDLAEMFPQAIRRRKPKAQQADTTVVEDGEFTEVKN